MTRVLYVAGYGRSGSTVLDMLLGNHPDVFGAGELVNLFAPAGLERGICSCGEPVHGGCLFWAEVMRRTGIGPAEMPALHRVTRALEGPAGSLRERLDPGARARYGQAWEAVFEAIHQVSGRPLVVDSSKTSPGMSRRPNTLRVLARRHTQVLHLVRDPRAVALSRSRGDNRLLEQGRIEPRSMLRTTIGWLAANAAAQLHRGSGLRLRYEDLVAAPETAVAEICARLEISPAPLLRLLSEDRALEPGHGVDGNRARRAGPVRLRRQDAAAAETTFARALLIAPASVFARGYGYPLLPESEAPRSGTGA